MFRKSSEDRDNKKRIEWIDSLKGIAIIGVVLIHAGGAHLPGIMGRIGSSGLYGVQMFFLISAFLTWTSLDNKFSDYVGWIGRKLKKLLPEYYIAYIFAILLIGEYSFASVIVHFSGLWGLFPQYNNTVMPEWYLGALILFYLIAPVIHRFVNCFGDSVCFLIVSLVITQVFQLILRNLYAEHMSEYAYDSYVYNVSIWAQLPVLALGIVLHYLIRALDRYMSECGISLSEKKKISLAFLVISVLWCKRYTIFHS